MQGRKIKPSRHRFKIPNGSKFLMFNIPDGSKFLMVHALDMFADGAIPYIIWMLRLGRDAVHSLRPARSKVFVNLGVRRAPS